RMRKSLERTGRAQESNDDGTTFTPACHPQSALVVVVLRPGPGRFRRRSRLAYRAGPPGETRVARNVPLRPHARRRPVPPWQPVAVLAGLRADNPRRPRRRRPDPDLPLAAEEKSEGDPSPADCLDRHRSL